MMALSVLPVVAC